jgi:phospholipase C
MAIIASTSVNGPSSAVVADGHGRPTPISATTIRWETFALAPTGYHADLSGKNIGDLLNAADGLSWGWFQGGFDLTLHQSERHNGLQAAARFRPLPDSLWPTTCNIISHSSTINPPRIPRIPVPSNVASIGLTDAANHQYDIA